MKLSKFAFRLLPAFVLGCGVASANAILVATDVDRSRGGNLIFTEGSAGPTPTFTDVNGLAGVIFITLTDGSKVLQRDTLCVDLFTYIYINNQYDTHLLRPDGVTGKNLDRASWLVDNALLPAQNSNYGSELAQTDWILTPAQGMGIQFAIWDIVHDNGDGFGAGRVRATTVDTGLGVTDPAVLDWAQKYETASLGKSSNQAFVYNNFDAGNGTLAQMLIGPQFADGGPQPVPEPGTLLSMGMALVALSLGLKWRHGKHA